ncbi:FAD/NAD-P-binding domain-containing protein [Gautieria morchelliformis]|nr:FAD/NAD-P-binding domain-containing protein [Gautieria morchelliformis]
MRHELGTEGSVNVAGEPVASVTSNTPLVVIVGAGPVGCLAALAFAKEGWRVEIYEGRPDMRLPSSRAALAQRSVNLAISSRGLAALYSVDRPMMLRILEDAIPMKGRLLHTRGGKTESQLYDPNGQCINSIDRGVLNEYLLQETLVFPTISVFFKHKLLTADFDTKSLSFRSEDKNQTITAKFDLCIGTDGSYSNVRRQMMRMMRMDYQQEYISHEYVELKIPAGTDAKGGAQFLLDPNHLHIWPRHSFMLIALPNKDRTFTCTLFAPTSEFDQLTTRSAVSAWFKAHFPDAVELIGEGTLVEDFRRNPRNSLISLKVKPYHYRDRCIILGDAAHSMVPFYGQGLNCGLEDVRVLMNILRREGAHQPRNREKREDIDVCLEGAFQRYSETRHDDLVAIRDMAMANYVEMRHSVTTPSYVFRKMIDDLFAALSAPYIPFSTLAPTLADEPEGFPGSAPRGWLPLYTMVTFRPDISYATAKKKAENQSTIITGIGLGSLGVGIWIGLAGIRAILGRGTREAFLWT